MLVARLESALAQLERPLTMRSVAPRVCVDKVQPAAGVLSALHGRLVAAEAVDVHGLALVSAPLHDGGGPLYRRDCAQNVERLAREALDALG